MLLLAYQLLLSIDIICLTNLLAYPTLAVDFFAGVPVTILFGYSELLTVLHPERLILLLFLTSNLLLISDFMQPCSIRK